MPIRDVPFRIVLARYKVLYLVGWVAFGLLLGRFMYPLMPGLLPVIIGNLVFIALVVVAVRSFRGASEAVAPPRAWWRMTGTVRSALVVAALLLVVQLLSLSDEIGGTPGPTPLEVLQAVLNGVENLVLIALYINSAVRLHRSPDPVVQKPVTLPDRLINFD